MRVDGLWVRHSWMFGAKTTKAMMTLLVRKSHIGQSELGLAPALNALHTDWNEY